MPNDKNLRDISRAQYSPGALDTSEQIKIGALQRIADATEVMATNYKQMQQDLNWYMGRYSDQKAEIKQLQRQLSAQKGLVTRAKNRKK